MTPSAAPEPPAVLLHGLAGHAGEWEETAAWLGRGRRVAALDLPGHGDAERRPEDVSPAALAAHVVGAVEELGAGPVLLVGQSLGGLVAIDVAARRPELVAALAVVEAGPAAPADPEAVAGAVEDWLRGWPVPFGSLTEAEAFFGGPSPRAAAWARGLERGAGGLRPRFEVDVLARMLREALAVDRWPQWSRIEAPALVVRGAAGTLPAAVAERMVAEGRRARLVEVPGTGHELHLEAADAWRRALEGFLAAAPS